MCKTTFSVNRPIIKSIRYIFSGQRAKMSRGGAKCPPPVEHQGLKNAKMKFFFLIFWAWNQSGWFILWQRIDILNIFKPYKFILACGAKRNKRFLKKKENWVFKIVRSKSQFLSIFCQNIHIWTFFGQKNWLTLSKMVLIKILVKSQPENKMAAILAKISSQETRSIDFRLPQTLTV